MPEYQYKDTEFTTQENVYLVYDAFLPLKNFLEDLTELFKTGLERNVYDSFQDRFKKLNEKDTQDKSDLKEAQREEPENLTLIKDLTDAIAKNVIDLETLNKEYSEDETAQAQRLTLDKAGSRALQKALRNYELVKGFLEVYLIGDVSKLDFKDVSLFDFTDRVILDFFLSLQKKTD